ncbi:MBL fold hydrolase [Elstera cyanobacteriorum]|uniref:MBL fold hydrolase n=1 Tax=Elstera cyanobacteriorum TaxID=2022747 RepID=A0A255XNI5_9PROT|nr:ribonuclease J [Elstera cyanobacteriorum]OYQ18536.1 MBL fold hydrolase [Elstera cyanobacteriorum]GFZ79579.1 MBL fold hydrolase [Elstera cyanobacteriorum]
MIDGTPLHSAIAARGELLFLPLGGAGEIGMNLNLFGYNGQWVMVDLGVTFGDDSQPSIDVIMPDPVFIAERRDALLGIVLTHAHEDHIGAVPHLWRRLGAPPIYCTPFTASVLRRKLPEYGLARDVVIHEVPLSGDFSLGPFRFQMITLTHSIPEPNALAIHTPVGTVLHTGDWKFDPEPLVGQVTDFDTLKALGDKGILALVGDSTNVFKPGEAGSEAAVRASLTELIGQFNNRVAVACFASNVARLESIVMAAAAHGRRVALVGRSLHRMVESARENGYLADLPPLVSEDEVGYLPPEEVLLLCTGSQGEQRAALARIAANDHPHVVLEEGDAVIFSSRIIPGNEKSIGRLHDKLIKQGIEVVTEQDHFIHVSGHPARDELARMYALTRPKIAVPVHGELRHLYEHAELARECQVPTAVVVENGDVLRLAPGEPMVLDKVPTGRLAVDGSRLVPLGGAELKQRLRMTYNGMAVATLVLDKRGNLQTDPVLTLHGLVDAEQDEAQILIDKALDAIEDVVETFAASGRGGEDTVLRDAVKAAVRRIVHSAIGLKPVTEVHLIRL